MCKYVGIQIYVYVSVCVHKNVWWDCTGVDTKHCFDEEVKKNERQKNERKDMYRERNPKIKSNGKKKTEKRRYTTEE